MRNDIKGNLENLSKEQLIYIIAQYDFFYVLVGEACVRESKGQLESEQIIDKIREYCCDLRDILSEVNIENTKSHLTIGDLIKNKDYDYVEYRVTIPSADEQKDVFAGAFRTESGKIITLDGGIYDSDKEIIKSEEWSNPENGIKNGLTITVNGDCI